MGQLSGYLNSQGWKAGPAKPIISSPLTTTSVSLLTTSQFKDLKHNFDLMAPSSVVLTAFSFISDEARHCKNFLRKSLGQEQKNILSPGEPSDWQLAFSNDDDEISC